MNEILSQMLLVEEDDDKGGSYMGLLDAADTIYSSDVTTQLPPSVITDLVHLVESGASGSGGGNGNGGGGNGNCSNCTSGSSSGSSSNGLQNVVTGHTSPGATSSSGVSSCPSSGWSGNEDDLSVERDELSAMLELNCNDDDDFSCFSESILFGEEASFEEDEEEALPTAVTTTTSTTATTTTVLVTRDPVTKLYHCQHCPKSFQYSSRLIRHLTAHQRKRFRCNQCDKLFSRRDVLYTHAQKVHKKRIADNAATKQFTCADCGATLKSPHHLERHRRSWHGDFACPHCAKRFSERRKYQRHLRQHQPGSFACADCGARFLQREFLRRHRLTHTGELPFACSDCGRQFNQSVNLRQHVERVHGGGGDNSKAKAHACDQCDKRFRTHAELRNHRAYHDGRRQFGCGECNAKFFEKRHLDRHMRRVHARIRNFFCDGCGRTFFEKYELNFHQKKCQAKRKAVDNSK